MAKLDMQGLASALGIPLDTLQSKVEENTISRGKIKKVAVEEVNNPGYYFEDSEKNLFYLQPMEGVEVKVYGRKIPVAVEEPEETE